MTTCQLVPTEDVASAPFFIANAGFGVVSERRLFFCFGTLPSASTNPVAYHLHVIGDAQATGSTFTAPIIASTDPALDLPLPTRAQLKEFAAAYEPEQI